MASINKVILIGNLTRDPELTYTPSGTEVCEIGLALNRRAKRHDEWVDEVTFVDVTLWGNQAKSAAEYLVKGRQVYIEGRLKLDQWEDKTTGKHRSKLTVVGETVQFLGSKHDAERPKQERPRQPLEAQPQPEPKKQWPAPNNNAAPPSIDPPIAEKSLREQTIEIAEAMKEKNEDIPF